MERTEILAKAEAYVKAETNTFFRGQVEKLIAEDNIAELTERFYQDLEFGTGGLRGEIGGGYNRINAYTIRKATQALANYVLSLGIANPSAAIACDSRNYSDLFAEEAAKVLAANGIKAYLYESLRPTPQLSFTVRELGCTTGIVVTASHNPSKYNGYKVYWNDGCQVTPPHDIKIVELANSVTEIKDISKEDAIKSGMIEIIGEDLDKKYIDMVKDLSIRPELIRSNGKDVKVVFTPLHGTGNVPVARALSEMGIDVIFVKEQQEPNGDFPTIPKPNPEEQSALQMAIDLAKKENADLVLATDPDADRLGIAVPDANGEWVLITGNQLGALLSDYIFSAKKESNTMPARPAFIKTIVTTNLQKKIAESYGATSFDVLTGFKYIGEKIREFEADKSYDYCFGGEESYGYLIGTAVRDKDAVSAAMMTAELCLYQRSQGRSLLTQLETIWEKYGYYQEALINMEFEGQAGQQKIGEIMKALRADLPKELAGIKVASVTDYAARETTIIATGAKVAIDLPKSNVLQFILEDETIVTARPSGTEPKIKFYVSASQMGKLADARPAVAKKVESIEVALKALVG